MMFELSHRTHYRYSSAVAQSQHRLHMSPRQDARQRTLHHSILIEPAPTRRHETMDAFGNPVVAIELEVPHKELLLQARSTIQTSKAPEFDLNATTSWDALAHKLSGTGHSIELDVLQMRSATRLTTPTGDFITYARPSFTPHRPVLDAAMDLSRRMFREFKFDATATDVSTPIQRVLAEKRGVCQDFSHVALACLRAFGLPARYVSGYILTHPPPGQPKLAGADASHAWISVWSPEYGWVDFDPTNGILVSEEHVTIAYGRDYDDVSPIVGVLLGGGDHTVDVAVDLIESGSTGGRSDIGGRS